MKDALFLLNQQNNTPKLKTYPPGAKILLLMPPFFTPWTPPLGITILKTFLEQRGYFVKCIDLNTDPKLWGKHHEYFKVLQSLEDVSTNDGYSKLWYILDAHLLAHVNHQANPDTCSKLLKTIGPLYGIYQLDNVINTLISITNKYFERLNELVDGINLSDFSVVGASTYTTSLASSLFILNQVKQKYPHITTLMGGGIFADDLAMDSDNLNTLLKEYPNVDHIIIGEGELLFLKLLQGELSPKRVLSISDLDHQTLNLQESTVPDFSDLNLDDYYELTIEGARSCPFQCDFCSETMQWGVYRKKPASLLLTQVVEMAQRYNHRAFFMADSLMNPYIKEFSTELLKANTDVLYDGYLRADKPVTDRQRVKLWADSGLYRVRLGLESASARVLKLMHKQTNPKVISEALKSLANAGIRTTTYWVVGFPGETEEDFEETLEFVRQHHRYIYEFEAHPYYYYPYGQVGSRSYECQPLYSDEVTRIIKFQEWEIANCQPIREERYDRLRRISALGSELGLPNIYSMKERYDAEKRWHALHPLASEVLDGTQPRRNKVHLSGPPLKVFSTEVKQQSSYGTLPTSSVWCYQAHVKQRLNEATLSESLEQLIYYNEVLQLGLQDGLYLPMPEEEKGQQHKLVVVHEGEVQTEDELNLLKSRIIQKLSGEMKPERGASVRLAVINHETCGSEVLLLVHRAIADSWSVSLLFEELFRIYQQLSHKKPISLLPISKSYSDLINELTTSRAKKGLPPNSSPTMLKGLSLSSSDQASVTDESMGTTRIAVEKHLIQRMTSKALAEYDLKPTEVLVAALVKSLHQAKVGQAFGLEIIDNYRTVDATLKHTPGVLTYTYQLTPQILADGHGVTSIQEIRQLLRRLYLDKGAFETFSPPEAGQARLDLQYFVKEPWLGGDEWIPQGFLRDMAGLRTTYLLEVTPILLNDGLEVYVKSRGQAGMKLMEEISTHLVLEMEAILTYCEGYVRAKHFWLKEFSGKVLTSSLDLGNNRQGSVAGEWSSTPCVIDLSEVEEACAKCKTSPSILFLAAYSTLLSRLNGREDLVIVSSFDEQKNTGPVPLRLFPAWNLSFSALVREIEQKSLLVFEHGAYTFDVFANELPDSSGFTFEMGYIFKSVERQEGKPGEEALAHDLLNPGLVLILEISKSDSVSHKRLALRREPRGDEALKVQFIYKSNRFDQELTERLGAYLNSILAEASRDGEIRLGDIVLDDTQKNYDSSKTLVDDLFHF